MLSSWNVSQVGKVGLPPLAFIELFALSIFILNIFRQH